MFPSLGDPLGHFDTVRGSIISQDKEGDHPWGPLRAFVTTKS